MATNSEPVVGLERTSWMRSILQVPWIYETFQRSVGKNKLRRRLVADYVQPAAGDRVLDIGCGPGDLVPFLHDVEFIGYDISTSYIAAARSRFGDSATFLSGGIDALAHLSSSIDTAVCIGVLHHVPDDTAVEILTAARDSLKPQGRFIAVEPHLYPGQNLISRELIKRDRGQFVRSEDEYRSLCESVFGSVDMVRDEQLLRVPYTLSIYTCLDSRG